MRIGQLLAEPIGDILLPAHELHQRAFPEVAGDFNPIAQSISIQAAAGRNHNVVSPAAFKLVSELRPIIAAGKELEEVGANGQRRPLAIQQWKRYERLGCNQPLALHAAMWKERREPLRRSGGVGILPATYQLQLRP